MSTVKTPILKNVSSALTTLYTNTSGGNAILKTTDIVGNSDGTLISKTGGDDWGFFGTGTPYFACHTSYMYGVPYPVRLGPDRVLLFNLPHHLNYGCTADYFDNNTLTAQICEYQTNKYVCGPISFVIIPDAIFDGSSISLYKSAHSTQDSGQLHFKAIALTPTKVLIIYRTSSYFRAVRLSIVGNQIDVSSTVSFNLQQASYFGTTAAQSPFDVIGIDSDKAIVFGWNNSTGQNNLVPLSVPDSGSITALSNSYVIAIGTVNYGCTIAKHTKTATANVYSLILGMGYSTSIQIQMCTWNSSTYAFGTTSATTITGLSNLTSISSMSLSSGTTGKSVVAFTDAATAGSMRIAYQTGTTLATNTTTSLSFGDANDRPIYRALEWGDDRALFLCKSNGIMCVDSTGAIKNMLLQESGAMLTTSVGGSTSVWFPFDSRPLFTCKGTESNWQWQNQYFARIGMISATDIGNISFKGNYLPYGHNYGGHYSWSEKMNCWLVGFGCKIFAINSNGVVLNEMSIKMLEPTIDFTYKAIRGLVAFPSGKIILALDHILTHPSQYLGLQWNQLSSFALALSPIKIWQDLGKATLSAGLFTSGSTGAFADLMGFVDVNGQERGALLYYYTSNNMRFSLYDGTGWSTETTTAIPGTTISTWNVGVRAPYRWIQDSPCDLINPQGLWRIVGGYNTTTLAYITNPYISGTAYAPVSFGSLDCTGYQISTNGSSVYKMGVAKQVSSNISAITIYDATLNRWRLLATVNGRLNYITGLVLPIGSTTRRYTSLTVGDSHISVVAQSTSGNSVVDAQACIFDMAGIQTEQYAKYTASGSGWINNSPTTIYTSKLYGGGVDAMTTSCLAGELATFNVVLNNGTSDISLTPATGLPVTTGNSNRSNTAYLIPNGGSIKVSSSIDNVFDAMLGIVEDI